MTRLAQIRARLEKATPGPWECVPGDYVSFIGEQKFRVLGAPMVKDGDRDVVCGSRVDLENAQLIAHAPSDLAADVEAWLAQAPVVYKYKAPGGKPTEADWSPQIDDDFGRDKYSHTARLVCIQPIVRDTAESLLRELIAETDSWGRSPDEFERIKDRARKLLEGK